MKKSKRARVGRKYPRRSHWIAQRDLAYARAGDNCEVSGEKLVGRAHVVASGVVLHTAEVWERAADHVIPERAVRQYCKGADPHILENLLVLTPSLHAQKTAIEYLIFRWDIIGYKRELNRLGFPEDAFDKAWKALCESVKVPV